MSDKTETFRYCQLRDLIYENKIAIEILQKDVLESKRKINEMYYIVERVDKKINSILFGAQDHYIKGIMKESEKERVQDGERKAG
mgnify:CR=1|jgi:hypothetical protein|tara:strand:+ start:1075 stop:1329 length:255 start_codon:yes stop_codon:yes gene_type:complete